MLGLSYSVLIGKAQNICLNIVHLLVRFVVLLLLLGGFGSLFACLFSLLGMLYALL